jgi:hypothetical protein
VVKNPNENDAISQLNQLYQHEFISEPKYMVKEIKDENGKILWHVEIHVPGLNDYWKGDFDSKKKGNRVLAYKTLMEILASK